MQIRFYILLLPHRLPNTLNKQTRLRQYIPAREARRCTHGPAAGARRLFCGPTPNRGGMSPKPVPEKLGRGFASSREPAGKHPAFPVCISTVRPR